MTGLRSFRDRSRTSTTADRSRCPKCGAAQRAGSWLSAITFGSELGKWLLIGVIVLMIGLPLLAYLGVY